MDRLLFRKVGRAKYISHLDLMRTFQRMFIRAGIKIKHTEGFNPHPYVSFALPLSLGTESECELMDFGLSGNTAREDIPAILNRFTPEGIEILRAYEAGEKLSKIDSLKVRCTLEYDNGVPEKCVEKLNALFGRSELKITKKTKRGEAEVNIIPVLREKTIEQGDGVVVITVTLAAQAPTVSPAQLVEAIRIYEPECAPDFAGYLRLEVFGQNGKVFR